MLLKQSATVAVLLSIGLTADVLGVPGASSLVVAAAVVQTALGTLLLLLAEEEKNRATELIIEGRGSLRLRSIERTRRRLLQPNYRRRLARSLDGVRHTADRRRCLLRASRPLFRVDIVARVGPELARTAALLRSEHPEPAGVAMTERLLCDGCSPLYGDNIAQLREALDLILSRLER